MRNTFIKTLCEEAKNNKDIFLLTGDLGYGVLEAFSSLYPDRFINAGICEQNMTSVAAGLALEGKCCFTYSIGNFPTMRCLEQIRNDVAYNKLNVNIVAVGGGFSYGALGMSHHATEDFAIMRAIPNMVVFTPCDPAEAREAVKQAIKLEQPCYIRLARGTDEIVPHIASIFDVGKANKLCNGSDIAILTAGNIAGEAVRAAEILKADDISAEVHAFFTIKPIDRNLICNLADKYRNIITVEEHALDGGFGSSVSEVITDYGKGVKLHRLGLNNQFSDQVGTQDYLRDIYGISANKIAVTVKRVLEG